MNAFRTRPARAAAGIVFACLAHVSTPAFADVLASWNPAGTVDSSAPLPASTSNALITAGTLTGSATLTVPVPFANAYEFDNWPSGPLDTGDYLAFSVSGNTVTYSTVAFSMYNNFDGTGNWEIRSSADNYAGTLDSGTFSGIFGGGELITANVAALGTRSGNVQFRLYTFNNAGTTNPLERGIRGTGGGGQGLSINGTVTGTGVQTSIASTPALGAGRWLLLVALVLVAWRGLSLRRKDGVE